MPDSAPLVIGATLGDRYRVDELLSMGGMGAVYAGTHTLLEKRVAIKVLRSDLPADASTVDRFHREAVAASAIGHENIVQVSDMGITAEGTPYLVMELLEGKSLSELMRSECPLPVVRACEIARDILRGVAAAHEAGIVHRDLKPDNVFLVRQGDREIVKLLDFGVSLLRRADMGEVRLTSTGAVVGTPRYMAPEQLRGALDLTGAADIYAAGVVLHEMLTGESPYQGQNYNAMVHEILGGEGNRIEERRADLPPALTAIVQRAMALAPAGRFASAAEMAAALEAVIAAADPAAPQSRRDGDPAGRLAAALAETVAAIPPASTPLAADEAAAPPAPRRAAAWRAVSDDPRWAQTASSEAPARPLARRAWPARTDDELRPRRDRSWAAVIVSLAAIAGVVAATLHLATGRDQEVADRSSVPERPGAIPNRPGGSQGATSPSDPLPRPAADPSASDAVAAADPADPASAAPAAPGQPPPASGSPPRSDPAPSPPPTTRQASTSRPLAAPAAVEAPSPAPPADQAPPAGAGSARAGPSPAAEGEVSIRLRVRPRSARVTIDDKPVSGERVELERSSRAVPVRVEAAGYLSEKILVIPDRDQDLSVELEKAPSPDPPPAEKKPPAADVEPPAAPEPERGPEAGDDGA